MSNKNHVVELLYFEGCPSWKNAHALLIDLFKNLEFVPDILITRVETEEEAIKNKFTGSPMIKVNGEDLFPTGQDNYALGCRVFLTSAGYRGWPTKEMLSEKLHDFNILN